jgi:predicted nucleic acid-binding protein
MRVFLDTNVILEFFIEREDVLMQFKDIEDSCQYQAAVAAGCDFIITYNVKDYPHTLLPVFSPSDFLQHE